MCDFFLSKGADGAWRFEYVDSDETFGVFGLANSRLREAAFVSVMPTAPPSPSWTLTLRERDGVLTIEDSSITVGPIFRGSRTQCPG